MRAWLMGWVEDFAEIVAMRVVARSAGGMVTNEFEDVTQLVADLERDLKAEREHSAQERERFSEWTGERVMFRETVLALGEGMAQSILSPGESPELFALRWRTWREANNV